MRHPGSKTAESGSPQKPADGKPAYSPFPELRGQDDPARPPSGIKLPSGQGAAQEMDLSMELQQLREHSPILDSMQDSAFKTAARFLLRSFWLQFLLFFVLSVVVVAAPMLASKFTGVPLQPGAFAYFMYFLLATLFFTRQRYKESFSALVLILLISVTFHLLQLYPGFKPTLYFWLTLVLVGGVNAFYYNDFTVTIGEQNLELRALRRELMATDRLVGKVSTKGGADEMAFVKKAQEEVAQTRAHYSSLIANLMQFGSGGPDIERGRGATAGAGGGALNYAGITRACWQVLKRSLGATRAEILFFDSTRNVLYTVKAFVSAANAAEGPFGFSAAPSEEISADKAKMTIPLEKESLFKHCVVNRRTILRNDIDREPTLRELEAKTPCPVHTLVPLLDGDSVLGVINISECPKTELSDEDKIILRTTSRLAAMALAHAQTFLQTKDELEQAKVLSVEERKKRAEILKMFKTLVSANIVEEILNDPSVMNPKRQRLTIVFVDLRGFTTLSERLDAALVVELLDDFFETLTPLIFKYGGTLDKYIGDEIMALWGAPFAKPGDTKNAILCTVEMMSAMESVKVRWKAKKDLDVAMGIAINTGDAIVGSIGSSANKNFTAIGDAVNTAARLEGLSEANQILMTRATYDDVRDVVKVRQLASQKVKGKEVELEIYEVIGLKIEGTQDLAVSHEPAAPKAAPHAAPQAAAAAPALEPVRRPPAPQAAAARTPLASPPAQAPTPARPAAVASAPGAVRPVSGSAPGAVRSASGVVRAAAPADPARARQVGLQSGVQRVQPAAVSPSSAPGAVSNRTPAPAAPRPAPTSEDAQLDASIGSSRDLANRVAGASARTAARDEAAGAPSSRDLADRAGSRATPAVDACPKCRHVNRSAGLRRCDKCGEVLNRA